jgi:hypothetical protein
VETVIVLIILTLSSVFLPVFGGLVIQLFFPVFMGGLMAGCEAADRGDDFSITHLFSGFNQDLTALLIVGLVYLIGLLVIVTLCGVFLIVAIGGFGSLLELIRTVLDAVAANDIGRLINALGPAARMVLAAELIGLALYLPLLMLVWFAPALIVLNHLDALTAMKYSFIGCVKNLVPYLIYGAIGLIASICATLPFLLGWFILTPLFIIGIYLAYKDIFLDTGVDAAK